MKESERRMTGPLPLRELIHRRQETAFFFIVFSSCICILIYLNISQYNNTLFFVCLIFMFQILLCFSHVLLYIVLSFAIDVVLMLSVVTRPSNAEIHVVMASWIMITKTTEWGILFNQNPEEITKQKPWVRRTKGFCLRDFFGGSGWTECLTRCFLFLSRDFLNLYLHGELFLLSYCHLPKVFHQ